MKKILLFSDYKVIYEITYKIIEEDYKLEWRTYDLVEGNQHFVPDAVIMLNLNLISILSGRS